jgi:hypothetical protein
MHGFAIIACSCCDARRHVRSPPPLPSGWQQAAAGYRGALRVSSLVRTDAVMRRVTRSARRPRSTLGHGPHRLMTAISVSLSPAPVLAHAPPHVLAPMLTRYASPRQNRYAHTHHDAPHWQRQ